MFRFLLSVVALVTLTAAVASPLKGDETKAVTVIQDTPHDVVLTEGENPTQADAAHGVLQAEKRITKLPQDENKFYMTVMGSKKDQKYKDIQGWVQNVPELKAIKDQTHYHEIDTTMQVYAERYEKTVPALPCVRVQDATGKTLYQASGNNIPATGEAMAKALSTECLFRWRRNRPQPNPNPDPAPNPDTDGDDEESDDEVQPDINIKVGPKDGKPADENHTQIVLGVLAALGIGLALGGGHAFVNNLQQYRTNHHR